MKSNNGITLVALIITVVIMLILAGVAIGTVTGDGLFSKTRDAVGAYENATRKEADQIQSLMNEIDKYLTGGDNEEVVVPEKVAIIGDFVNYSVEVDNKIYDKWRILNFDNDGHIEIVCYNGPDFTLGHASNVTKGKSDYANVINLLNNESVPYGTGTYGCSTRHLGSNPSDPSSYAKISTSYLKYYTNYNNIKSNENYKYINQVHHESDLGAVQAFINTAEGKKLLGDYTWLASRKVLADSRRSYFYLNLLKASGAASYGILYSALPDGRQFVNSRTYRLAPVVSLESDVKINTSAGDGSKDSPWELTKF